MATETELPPTRIRDWWILEGKRYRGLEDGLTRSMARVHRLTIALLTTYNPRWQVSPVPYGETDWIATALRRATTTERDYVVRASQTGLDADERAALLGWVAWIRQLHADYFAKLGLEAPALPEWTHAHGVAPTAAELRRWTRLARRSRWPLLRNIVAESLRCVSEADALDQLPLPSAHENLFELACLVRILKALSTREAIIRWLDRDLGNTVRTPELTARYQYWLEDEVILRADLYPAEALTTMRRHRFYPPRKVDLLIELAAPRGGFRGILVECKSGQQAADSSIYQLLAYRSALRKRIAGRVLVWGIVEKPLDPELPPRDGTSDCWVFSSAHHIAAVLEHFGLASAR